MNDNNTPIPAATKVDRLRYLIDKEKMTQAQFANKLGVNPSNLSKVLSGKLPFSESLINRIVVDMGISKNWLRDGMGVPYERSCDTRSVKEGDVSKDLAITGTPIYDIDVTAGCRELSSMFTDDRIIGYINLPQVDSTGAILRVCGDSMIPTIKNGGFVAIRRVSPGSPIYWGQIYVIVLDDYRMVKFVRRHKDPDKVILHSDNPAYDDMEVPISEIRGYYLVESILNFDIRC